MNRFRMASLALLMSFLVWTQCDNSENNSDSGTDGDNDASIDADVDSDHDDQRIEETSPPEEGFVHVRIESSFGIDDSNSGIDLPSGIQVWVRDGMSTPIADAEVNLYPLGVDPTSLVHQSAGRYELDALQGRLSPPESEYYVEVQSEHLVPNRVVLRVEHTHLSSRPDIELPEDRSEHQQDQPLNVRWNQVEGANCYDVGTREHELEEFSWVHECIESTEATLDSGQIEPFIAVRARRSAGDESFTDDPFFSLSTSDSQVRIFIVSR